MPWPLITQLQIESRVSKLVVQRLLDDDNDGNADTDAVTRLRLDASSKVAGAIAQVYSIEELRLMQPAELPDEVVRLTLDVAQAMLAQRHPEFARGVDAFELMKQAERDLKMVRRSERNLGVATAPEPANNTASVVGGLPPFGSFVR